MIFDEAIDLIRYVSDSSDPAMLLGEILEANAASPVDLDELARDHPALLSVANVTVPAIKKLMLSGPERDRFYAAMWGLLSSNALFPTEEEKALAILYLQSSPLVPYLQLPLLSMSDEDFLAYREKLAPRIEALRHVLQRDYLQKTQEASAMLAVLDACSGAEERAVLMSALLSMLRDGITN